VVPARLAEALGASGVQSATSVMEVTREWEVEIARPLAARLDPGLEARRVHHRIATQVSYRGHLLAEVEVEVELRSS
jgi:hypothetical protein